MASSLCNFHLSRLSLSSDTNDHGWIENSEIITHK